MLFSGIHFNFSFPTHIIELLYEQSNYSDLKQLKNDLYLDLGKKIVEYSWLIVYLTAASPILDTSFKGCSKEVLDKYASPRCSEIGYWNDFVPVLNFDGLDDYIDSVETYLKKGQLKAASELYYPVRFKPRGENDFTNLRENGINHIELRMLDLNPLSSAGIDKRDLLFIYLLINYLIAKEPLRFREEEQILAIHEMKQAALYDETKIDTFDKGIKVLEDMEDFFKGQEKEVMDCLDFEKNKFLNPSNRYAVIIREMYQNDYLAGGLKLAKSQQEEVCVNYLV
ncbi:Glutamate--cysteine ligase [Lachnospiraceae bacterium TWA4]|nr:Glutamate--cysteine ligase [Lachnospiraceae bacterium TWA4]